MKLREKEKETNENVQQRRKSFKREQKQATQFLPIFSSFSGNRAAELQEGDGLRLGDIPVAAQCIEYADEDDEAVKVLHTIIAAGEKGIEGERVQRILQHNGFKAQDQENLDMARTRVRNQFTKAKGEKPKLLELLALPKKTTPFTFVNFIEKPELGYLDEVFMAGGSPRAATPKTRRSEKSAQGHRNMKVPGVQLKPTERRSGRSKVSRSTAAEVPVSDADFYIKPVAEAASEPGSKPVDGMDAQSAHVKGLSDAGTAAVVTPDVIAPASCVAKPAVNNSGAGNTQQKDSVHGKEQQPPPGQAQLPAASILHTPSPEHHDTRVPKEEPKSIEEPEEKPKPKDEPAAFSADFCAAPSVNALQTPSQIQTPDVPPSKRQRKGNEQAHATASPCGAAAETFNHAAPGTACRAPQQTVYHVSTSRQEAQRAERMRGGARDQLSTALNSFCESEECTSFDGTVRPDSAMKLVNALVSAASKQVPAYAKCLTAEGKQLTSGDEYESAVTLSKQNYFGKFSLRERCWDGVFNSSFLHFSSGSTGTPTLWPRTIQSELEVALTFERIMKDAFQAHMQPTLCLNHLTMKGYRLTIVTPGNKPPEILSILSNLKPAETFAQTIIFGYPPFVKGVIDAAAVTGMDWQPLNVGLVLAGECYSESWRQLASKRACIQDPERRIVSMYGTADAGVIAAETELCAKIRCFLHTHPAARKELLKSERMPTLCQYDPHNRFLDLHAEDRTLVVTCVPQAIGQSSVQDEDGLVGAATIKYAINDAGGLMDYHAMISWLQKQGMKLEGVDAVRRTLPFVWVFGRAFWCVSLFGANVFVENIMGAVAKPEVAEMITGKFVLEVEEVEAEEVGKRVLLRVEVAKGTSPSEEARELLMDIITTELKLQNSEYSNYVPDAAQRVRVVLYENGDPEWFATDVKHKYTRDN